MFTYIGWIVFLHMKEECCFMLRKGGIKLKPVSPNFVCLMLGGSIPVSYTHLDVYKRQRTICFMYFVFFSLSAHTSQSYYLNVRHVIISLLLLSNSLPTLAMSLLSATVFLAAFSMPSTIILCVGACLCIWLFSSIQFVQPLRGHLLLWECAFCWAGRFQFSVVSFSHVSPAKS